MPLLPPLPSLPCLPVLPVQVTPWHPLPTYLPCRDGYYEWQRHDGTIERRWWSCRSESVMTVGGTRPDSVYRCWRGVLRGPVL